MIRNTSKRLYSEDIPEDVIWKIFTDTLTWKIFKRRSSGYVQIHAFFFFFFFHKAIFGIQTDNIFGKLLKNKVFGNFFKHINITIRISFKKAFFGASRQRRYSEVTRKFFTHILGVNFKISYLDQIIPSPFGMLTSESEQLEFRRDNWTKKLPQCDYQKQQEKK